MFHRLHTHATFKLRRQIVFRETKDVPEFFHGNGSSFARQGNGFGCMYNEVTIILLLKFSIFLAFEIVKFLLI